MSISFLQNQGNSEIKGIFCFNKAKKNKIPDSAMLN